MRILIINQYFYPDHASTGLYAHDICREIAQSGIEVEVVTAQPCYSEESPAAPSYEEHVNIRIHRISMGRYRGRKDIKKRVIGYLRFLVRGYRKSNELLKKRKFDLIITFHNPPLVGFLGAVLAKKYNTKFMYILYDIHPEIIVASGWRIPTFVLALWDNINGFIFNRADKIIVLSDGMKRTLRENKKVKADKIKIIPLWAKPEINSELTENLIKERLDRQEKDMFLLYAGNMGVSHPVEIIIEARKAIRDCPIKILFVGDGVKKQYLLDCVNKENIRGVEILPFQPLDNFISLLTQSDACLVTIARGLENMALPSRVFTYLSAGKPIIAVMDDKADLAKVIKEFDCGWVVNSSQDLASLIQQIAIDKRGLIRKSQNAKNLYNNFYKKEIIVREYVRMIEDIVKSQT